MVKNLPAMWETQVVSLGWEALLEKDMATHSSIFAQRIPWTEEPGGLQSMGSKRAAGHDWVSNANTTIFQSRQEIYWGCIINISLCHTVESNTTLLSQLYSTRFSKKIVRCYVRNQEQVLACLVCLSDTDTPIFPPPNSSTQSPHITK